MRSINFRRQGGLQIGGRRVLHRYVTDDDDANNAAYYNSHASVLLLCEVSTDEYKAAFDFFAVWCTIDVHEQGKIQNNAVKRPHLPMRSLISSVQTSINYSFM